MAAGRIISSRGWVFRAALTFLAGLMILPVPGLIFLSLVRAASFPAFPSQRLTLDVWRLVMAGEEGLAGSLSVSLGLSLTVAAVATLAGWFCSRYLERHRFSRWLRMLPYLPFVLSPVIYAVCLQYYFIRADLSGRWLGVWLGQLLIAFPYAVLFMGAFWTKQTAALEDLVATLGGTARDRWLRLLWPLSRPALLTCFFQTFLIAWFEYGLTSLLGIGQIQTLTVKVYQFVGEANTPVAAVASCLLIAPPLLLLWVNKRFLK